MLKQLTAIIFFAAFAMQTFTRELVVFDYFTNTKAYAKNCENMAKPKMRCNGKCQMMKKLKEEQKKDEQNPERKTENKSEYVVSSKSFYPTLQFHISIQEINFPSIPSAKAVTMPRSLLRPPIC